MLDDGWWRSVKLSAYEERIPEKNELDAMKYIFAQCFGKAGYCEARLIGLERICSGSKVQ